MTILKVSSSSSPNMVAGAIAGAVRESGRAELHAVGAGATNQAVKAIAIAEHEVRDLKGKIEQRKAEAEEKKNRA